MKVTLDLPSAQELIESKGFSKNGKVQLFHTNNVSRRIEKFMPKRSGALRGRLKQIQGGSEIKVNGPYAKYQYHGMVMAGRAPKHVTSKPLQYGTGGPKWDRALVAEEGKVIEAELQAYIRRG